MKEVLAAFNKKSEELATFALEPREDVAINLIL